MRYRNMDLNWKTNQYEVIKIAKLIDLYVQLFKRNGVEWTSSKLGIIAPYRAQIAAVKKQIETQYPELHDYITVDTVERYQGGARDIIIFSLCTNKAQQLKSLVSISEDGVDRKLNVALTRAREQLIIIGNEDILDTQPIYKDLISSAFKWKL